MSVIKYDVLSQLELWKHLWNYLKWNGCSF